jgi:hypothetical protein
MQRICHILMINKNGIKLLEDKMEKYRISVDLEFDSDYHRNNQIEDIKNKIAMLIADYNCFLRIGDVVAEKLSENSKK